MMVKSTNLLDLDLASFECEPPATNLEKAAYKKLKYTKLVVSFWFFIVFCFRMDFPQSTDAAVVEACP